MTTEKASQPIGVREAKRRAKFMAAELIDGSIDAGLDVASYTETDSDEEADLLERELRAVADSIRKGLPSGYRLDPRDVL